MNIKDVFYLALEDVRVRYPEYQFVVARDIVWLLQQKLGELLELFDLPYDVYYEYPLEKATREKASKDLVIVEKGTDYKEVFAKRAQAVAVFRIKYEPSSKRHDVCDYQLPRVIPSVIVNDILDMERLVYEKKTKLGLAVLIDEDSRHKKRIGETEFSRWVEWGNYKDENLNVSVLVTEFNQ